MPTSHAASQPAQKLHSSVIPQPERRRESRRLVAFGPHIFAPDHFLTWREQQVRNREMLSHALNLRDTIVFVGAGCSVPLGFPTWQQFVSGAVDMTAKKLQAKGYFKDHLARFKEQAESKGNAANFVFILGACEKMWAQSDAKEGIKNYRAALVNQFRDKQVKSNGCNPYDRLVKLPVQRFVTSNYDCALEEAIARKEGIDETAYAPKGERFGKQNFTQDAKYDEQLALFALAKAERERKVFHCHGWHHEPESMIITEADYQRWYLRDQHVGTGRFRQTIDLIFGSNPILFVGFSLRDDDLLVALRVLSAIDPARKHARPLFAVMEQESDDAKTSFEQIYDRYGVHVISYPTSQTSPLDELTGVCERFKSLGMRWSGRNTGKSGENSTDVFDDLDILAKENSAVPVAIQQRAVAFREMLETNLRRWATENSAVEHEQARVALGMTLENTVGAWIRADSLCAELDRIAKACRNHRAEWLKKPKLRKLPSLPVPPRPYFHYIYMPPKARPSAASKTSDPLLDQLMGCVLKRKPPKIVALIGPGGTGKSWSALELLKELSEPQARKKAGIAGFFFWSSYYTDDALNGIDRVLSYLQAPPDPTKSRVERLRECLTKSRKRYILVLDGVERFLHETSEPGHIQSNTALVGRLLEAVTDTRSHSTVLLTSRVAPAELIEMGNDPGKKEGIKIISAQGFTVEQTETLVNSEVKTKLERDRISSLVSWLGGHRYGIALAASWLKHSSDPNPFSSLLHSMSETDPEQRVSRMIGLSLDALPKDAKNLLEEIAVFTSPMSEVLVEQCVQILLKKARDIDARDTKAHDIKACDEVIARWIKKANKLDDAGLIKGIKTDLIRILTTRKMLFQVQFDDDRCRYIVHPTVREYVFHNLHHSAARDLPNLNLSGFTSGSDLVYPGDRVGIGILNSLFSTLHQEADPGFYKRANGPTVLISRERSLDACRSLFGLVRCRMVVNTVPRWTDYENYLNYLVRVIDATRNLLPYHWSYAAKDARDYAVETRHSKNRQSRHSKNQKPVFEDDFGPLYADEVAWLYNEAGLAYYSEGSILDAIAVWEQGYEINKNLDSEPEGGSYLFQSLCNLGAANIHFGRLRVAESYLRRAFDVGHRIKEIDHIARVRGYLGLVRHLQGNLEQAEEFYKDAIAASKTVGNLRAESIFLKHYADLFIKQGKWPDAATHIQTSRATAEAGHYPDLVAYARLSQGHYYRSQKAYPDAIREYRVALMEAKRMGIHRLEAEAHSELARVALDLGDAQVARRRAMKTLQIANEHILGLRQTHGMVILGKATVEAGERELGMYYLKHASKLAERQQYRIQYDEAEAALNRWGEHIEEPELGHLVSSTTQTQIQARARTA